MMNVVTMLMVWSAVLCPAIGFATANRGCQEIDLRRFKEIVNEQHVENVVFFASWCSSCRKHLLSHRDQESVMFIGTFDDQDNVSKAFQALFTGQSRPCYWDKDDRLARALGIKALPYAAKAKTLLKE